MQYLLMLFEQKAGKESLERLVRAAAAVDKDVTQLGTFTPTLPGGGMYKVLKGLSDGRALEIRCLRYRAPAEDPEALFWISVNSVADGQVGYATQGRASGELTEFRRYRKGQGGTVHDELDFDVRKAKVFGDQECQILKDYTKLLEDVHGWLTGG